jgi:hypothetical protein
MSLSLYQFVCHHIVGSEETVKTKRTLNTIRDTLLSNEIFKEYRTKNTSEHDTKMSLGCGLINC